jgi:hypothetical protein
MIPKRFTHKEFENEYCSFEPVTVFNYMKFKEFFENPTNVEEDLNKLEKYIYKCVSYKWGNSHFRFSNIFGHEFTFQIHGNTVHIWDAFGSVSLGNYPLSPDSFNEIMEISKRWVLGEKKCSDCGTWMNYRENEKHRYFAGIYCLDCWNRKWKAIEAKESYD